MRVKENNQPLLITAFVLTLGILITFQLYIFGEEPRIDAVKAKDYARAFEEGQQLFKQNCVVCHGENGEGKVGPALNSWALLNAAADHTLFSVISSGVPNTAMPAWSQTHGGPFTDEQVSALVTFIRAWEKTAPTPTPAPQPVLTGNPEQGARIFKERCVVCHGENGEGKVGPALNNPTKLAQFDDAWYRSVVNAGRPAKGMPTWGTVISPQDIADVVSFIRQWQTK